MKVLHVIPSIARVHGGPSRAVEVMERALSTRGIVVHTATTDDDGPGRHNGKPAGVPLQENGVVRFYFPKRLDFYKVAPGMAAWLARHAADYDLLHIHALFSFSSTAAGWAARRAQVPYVVRPLGTLDAYGVDQRRPLLKKASLQLLEARLLRSAAAVHFTSEAEAQAARRLGIPWREALIPLGIDPAPLPPASRDGWGLLFLSRLDPKKNLESLLKAVAMLAPEFPRLRLTVAGAGEPAYEAQLHGLAEALGIGSRVSWSGHLEGAAKADAFARSDVFVLPSFSENFGIAAAEALAAGLPCVLARGVALAAEVAAAGAGVVVETDAKSIAEGLLRMIPPPPDPRARSVLAARVAQERYSAEAMGERLERLYAGILAQPALA